MNRIHIILSVLSVILRKEIIGLVEMKGYQEELMEKEREAEEQNLNPELEYDIAKAHEENKTNRQQH